MTDGKHPASGKPVRGTFLRVLFARFTSNGRRMMRKRIVHCLTALAIGSMGWLVATPAAEAQVRMEAMEGWTFTFTGNINAFYVFETESDDGTVSADGFELVGAGRQGSTVRTGLLPAFASFEAATRQKNVDLMVHFGFAPQIQTPGGHDNFGNGTQAGAQIDMRQLYMTVTGEWGQILAGREIGVYQRQNILNDQTLFGVGATGGNFGDPGGTTLGRIGFGYVYPNFNAQLTYSSPADRPAQVTIGIFDPDTHNDFDEVVAPRVEGEITVSGSGVMAWAGGMIQNQKDTSLDETATSFGGHGGVKYSHEMFSVVGSGYYGEGIGTTLVFNGARTSVEGSVELRKSYGFIGQVTVTPRDSDVTLGASFGQSTLQNADDEGDAKIHNRSATGGIYYQATPALKVVGEGTYSWSEDDIDATEKNSSIVIAGGLMLFF